MPTERKHVVSIVPVDSLLMLDSENHCEEVNPGELVIDKTITAIIKAFRISPQYQNVLAVQLYKMIVTPLIQLEKCTRYGYEQETVAALAGFSLHQYKPLFAPSSELLIKGLFTAKHAYNGKWETAMTEILHQILISLCRTPEAVKRVVLGRPQKATLRQKDFDHITDEYVWMKGLLENAVAKKEQGVNVLIYGTTGTGKTELAKTICKEIGTSLFTVSGNRVERRGIERRSDLAAALSLLKDDQNSALLMDEAEDVFGVSRRSFGFAGFGDSDSASDSKSKLYFHKLLENNPVPVIWVCNSIDGVDSAHLRRYSYAMKMDAPDEAVQTRIWNYSARKHKVKLPKEKIDKLVKSYDIAPAIIDTSLRTAALTGNNDSIEKTIESLQTAMHGRSSKRKRIAKHDFSTALLNCDVDLENLMKRMTTLQEEDFSLCLYGVPGSGKSAYARFLAEKLKMRVLHKRASDLISMWVGETEKNIAAAFAEAQRKKMLLVFDEADSFLQDRRNAYRSWEVTQVNEMLTQMESHPLPFICTTNLMDGLDQASLRRFTFKVKYDFLTHLQVASAFKHFFGAEPVGSLTGLRCLSPGDFAVVAKKARICGIDNPGELATMLRQEQDVKDVQSNPIGFAMG